MKAVICAVAVLPMLGGCSMLIPPDDGQRPIEDLAPEIQNRVRLAALIAFSIDSVKPHKEQICQVANDIAGFLDTYDNPDATFQHIQAAVTELINAIPDPELRESARIVVEIVLTEAFNYAWKHYSDFINRNETQTAIIIAQAIANGLREACNPGA